MINQMVHSNDNYSCLALTWRGLRSRSETPSSRRSMENSRTCEGIISACDFACDPHGHRQSRTIALPRSPILRCPQTPA